MAYTRDFVLLQSSPKVKHLVILLAKQLDHLSQSNGLENVDLEMQPPAYQSEEVCHLAAATPFAWLAGEHLPT
jgi:translation elongation factor EF-Tu-like GTPase